MQFKSPLPGGRSLRMFATCSAEETTYPILLVANTGTPRAGQSTASGQRPRSHLEVVYRSELDDRIASRDAGIRKSSERDASWRGVLAGRFRAVMQAIAGFAVDGAAAFESILLAAMSWAIAQILTGCAEYCQAMYPTFVEPDESTDSHAATDGPQPDQGVANRPQRQKTAVRGTMTQSLPSSDLETYRRRTEYFANSGDHCE
jgi:hypothetical protein